MVCEKRTRNSAECSGPGLQPSAPAHYPDNQPPRSGDAAGARPLRQDVNFRQYTQLNRLAPRPADGEVVHQSQGQHPQSYKVALMKYHGSLRVPD